MSIPSHMTVTGENQGVIDGSCTMSGREGTILVYGLDHVLEIPKHKQDGLPTGKRVHGGVLVVKEVDKASCGLYQALCTGERLSEVVIKKYRIDDTGNEEHYFTVTLKKAIVQKIHSEEARSFAEDGQNVRHLEEVTFSYEEINWEHVVDSKAAGDSWNAPPGA
jgi:type VI secretion system secreted protein Hcp